MSYVLDTSGTLGANYVQGEAHVVSPSILSSFGLLFMSAGPIFGGGLVLRYQPADGMAARNLIIGADFNLIFQMVGFGATYDKQVWGAISLNNINLNGTISVSYQALGGNWSFDITQIRNYLNTNPFDANIQYTVLVPSPAIYVPASAATPFPLNSIVAIQQAQAYLSSIALGVSYYPLGSIEPSVDSVNAGASQLVQVLSQLIVVLGNNTTPQANVNIGNWPNPMPVLITNQTLADNAAKEAGGNLAAISAIVSKRTGAWAYKAGVSGTVQVTANVRVLQISAVAGGDADGSLSINGGDAVIIPAGQAITVSPQGNLVSPLIVFTGTSSYFIEEVQ